MPSIQELETRAICPSGYYYSNDRCYAGSAWHWGRWVLAGAVVLFVVFIFVILGCISARRRRRRGLNPMYGTGWMAAPAKYGEQGQYPPPGQQWGGGYGPQQYGMQPQYGPPKYGGQENQYQYGAQQGGVNPQYTGTTFQTSDGYYGGHNEGVQLQSPPNTYQPVYSPPVGPPPGK